MKSYGGVDVYVYVFLYSALGLKPIDMEVCYWVLLFMPLAILHHLLNVFAQLANKGGLKKVGGEWSAAWPGKELPIPIG
jgi:hypothetical protein